MKYNIMIYIIVLFLLVCTVTATELVFDEDTIRISIDLINGSGLWNESGANLLLPHHADSILKIPTLPNCDTIDTDANGVMSCGTDSGAGSIVAADLWMIANFTEAYDDRTDRWQMLNFTTAFASYIGTYQNETSAWKIANFTASYDARTDRFGIENLTGITSYNNENFTSNYATVQDDLWKVFNATSYYDGRLGRFGNENYTTLEDSAFRNENFTIRYDLRTDRWDESNDTIQLALFNTSISRNYVNITGDTMTGDLNMSSNTIYLNDDYQEGHSIADTLTHFDELSDDTILDKITVNFERTTDSTMNVTIVNLDAKQIDVNINRVEYTFGVNSTSVELINGTNESPQINFVSVQIVSGVPVLLAEKTYAGDRGVEHTDVAELLVGDDGYILSYSPLTIRLYESIYKFYERSEKAGGIYISGFSPEVSATQLNISFGKYLLTVYNVETVNNLTMSEGFFWVNASGGYRHCTDLSCIDQYSDGTAFGGGKSMNLIWGVVATNRTNVNLVAVVQGEPGTEYTSALKAEQDDFNTINYFPPNTNLRKSFIPIVHTMIDNNADEFEMFTSGIYYRFLGGKVTSGGGAPAPSPSCDTNICEVTNTGTLDGYEGTQFQIESSAFKIINFTTQYDSRTDRFQIENVTSYLGKGGNDSLVRMNVTNVGTLNITSNLSVSGILIGSGQEEDQFIYFYDNGNTIEEHIKWDDQETRFSFTDDIFTTGSVGAVFSLNSGDSIFTTGAGDNLWLGSTLEKNANFRAEADGDLYLNGLLNTSRLNVSDSVSFNALTNCDTLNTDGTGLLSCGTDAVIDSTAFKNENFTVRYDLRTDRYSVQNYSVSFNDNVSNGFTMTGELNLTVPNRITCGVKYNLINDSTYQAWDCVNCSNYAKMFVNNDTDQICIK